MLGTNCETPTGLNLIGASKILLYDMDWNPAHDIQAMARVWRDGQSRPVTIYRLATVGTIEEKIFQRQNTKQGLGGGLMDAADSSGNKFHFTKQDLKDLFSFNVETECETHDLLGCGCVGDGKNAEAGEEDGDERACQIGGSGTVGRPKAKDGTGSGDKGQMRDLLKWQHIAPTSALTSSEDLLGDENLAEAVKYISYAFKNVTDTGCDDEEEN